MSTLPDTAWQWILSAEGGEVDDPDDRGGHTRYGISANAYPDEDIANLTEARARHLYERDYWCKGHCPEMPARIALAHFDACVNHGVGRANRLLQKALGVRVDGLIGPVTLGAVRKAARERLLVQMLGRRAMFYAAIVRNDSSQAKYLRGWLLRTYRLQSYLYQEVSS